MREVISKLGLVDFKSCWSVIRENRISKLLEWNNALLEVISKVGLVDLMADNLKVKPAVVKKKLDDVTIKVSKGKELDVLKYKHKIEKEYNPLDNPNESDKGPIIKSESHEIQSESHVNHMEMQLSLVIMNIVIGFIMKMMMVTMMTMEEMVTIIVEAIRNMDQRERI
nr:hypothetical protein [Tanacetum cinerariifolium]